MIKQGKYGVVDIIGVSFIVIALISLGGIYYTTNTYIDINDAYYNSQAFVVDVDITRSAAAGEIAFQTTLFINNTSPLDIEILPYNVEYNVYVFEHEPDFDKLGYNDLLARFISPGRGVEGGNTTVLANSQKYLPLLMTLTTGETPTIYLERFDSAAEGGSAFVYIYGFAMFEIVDFPDVSNKIWFGYVGEVEIYEQ